MSQELENLISIVEVADFAEAISRIPKQLRGKSFFGHYDVWMYVAEGPVETNCDKCREFDAQDFMGSHLRQMFPDLIVMDEDTIYPNVHQTLWGTDTCCQKGTLVTTDKGIVPIEQIKLGDMVLTLKGRFKPVTQLHINYYQGKLYNIFGSWLTANHPVATLRGWVNAESLNENDDIINIKSVALNEPKNSPTLLAKKSVLFSINLPHSIITMRGHKYFISRTPIFPWVQFAVNFNSDLILGNSKIQIKNIQSKQRHNFYISFFKGFKEKAFKFAKFGIGLNLFSSLYKKLMSAWARNNAFMVCFNLMCSLFRRHLCPPHFSSFMGISSLNSCFHKSSNYDVASNTIMFSNNVFTDSSSVQSCDFVDWQVNSQRPFFQSATPLRDTYSKQFKGYVYNLSVADDETYCIGINQTVVHNCKCVLRRTLEPLASFDLYDGDNLEPYKAEEIQL